MKRKYALPELLAPAGDFSALVAAVSAGADAIYVGGKKFGARAFAKNFDEDELARAVRYCHIHGVRLYVTLNTLVTERELGEATEFAERLYQMGVDALIVADLGVAAKIRECVPHLELHASTQMGIHNTAGANEAARLGITRVVLARECSSSDINRITEKCIPECEIFVHGALCVCHSGQCLFSSLVGGRSGNRGECAQPCRLPYANGYALSLTDLSLSAHIKEIVASGVSSLKIEGRMKSADYVYRVVSVYRRLLDEGRDSNAGEREELARIFSRGGFTDGYFTSKLDKRMLGVRSEEDKRVSREISGSEFLPQKIKISAKASFALGKPSVLTLTAAVKDRLSGEEKVFCVSAEGDVPSAAINAPLEKASLVARLAKMGNTDYSLEADDITLTLDKGINLPPSAVNGLRRSAAEALDMAFSAPRGIETPRLPERSDAEFKLKRLNTALFFSSKTYSELMHNHPDAKYGIDVSFLPLFEIAMTDAKDEKLGAYLPPVIMESEWDEVVARAKCVCEAGVRYALIGNLSHIELCKEANLIPVADFRLNITNKSTLSYLCGAGVSAAILSPELTLPMARDIGGSVITLGRVPLMITERCFIKDSAGCDGCGKSSLTDRRGAKFPIMREFSHRNIIFNSTLTYMGDKASELRSYGIRASHFIFSVECAEECYKLIRAYRSEAKLDGQAVRRVGRRI